MVDAIVSICSLIPFVQLFVRSEVVEILLWQYVTGKAWEIAAWVIVTLLYILIIIHLKRHVSTPSKYGKRTAYLSE